MAKRSTLVTVADLPLSDSLNPQAQIARDDAGTFMDSVAEVLACFVEATDRLSSAMGSKNGEAMCEAIEGLVSTRSRALALVTLNWQDPC
jgi:hypothetical protein